MRVLATSLALLLSSCAAPAVFASPTPAPAALPVVELKYRVFDQIGRPWSCDSDFYPVARADETELARQRLPEMQRDADTYAAILRHTGIAPGADLSDDRLLAVYHERLPYRGRTYDVLPAGPTGAYWADGVLLGSTLRR